MSFVPVLFVTPPACYDELVFTCTMIKGARKDLCDINEGSTVSTFDTLTGEYTLESLDLDALPESTYIYNIEGRIGTATFTVSFVMGVLNPCTNIPIELLEPSSYFNNHYQALKAKEYYQEFTIGELAISPTEIDCGPMYVDFEVNDEWYLNPSIFNLDTDSEPYRFEALYVDDRMYLDYYYIRYGVGYTDYEDTQVNATDAFLIRITDSCDEPNSISPSVLVDQEYTVTGAVKQYQIDDFYANPTGCDITYSYSVTELNGSGEVSNID